MENHTTKNIVSAIGFGFFALLAAGSINVGDISLPFGKQINIDSINAAKDSLGASLEMTQDKSLQSKKEIKDAYTQMKTYLSENNLTDGNLAIMERNLDSMKAKYKAFKDTVEKCRDDSDNLFNMLEKRANENKTESLKKQLKEKIKGKRKTFDGHIEKAQEVLVKVDQSIQKYNDLVGYFQVNKGLEGVDKIMDEIDGVIAAGELLNEQINTFVQDSMVVLKEL
jgi:hypothetical protein